MKPALIVDKTGKRPNNTVLEAPNGQEETCSPLAIIYDFSRKCFVSRWEPTDEERQQIANGGSVYLMVQGFKHPPVIVCTELLDEIRSPDFPDHVQ